MSPILRLLFVLACAVLAALLTMQVAMLLLSDLPFWSQLLLAAVYGLASFLSAAWLTEKGGPS